MNKAKAEELAKLCVKELKRHACAVARQEGPNTFGQGRRARSTRSLMMWLVESRHWEGPKDWDSRAKALAALNRAMKKAEEMGLVQRYRYAQTGSWIYCGPEIEEAEKKYIRKEKEKREAISKALRVLGIPNYDTWSETHVSIRIRDILHAAERAGGVERAWQTERAVKERVE